MSDQTAKRVNNLYRILHELHFRGPLRRSKLSERLDIRKNSVGSMCDELLTTGIIEPADTSKPRSPLQISPDGIYALFVHAGSQGICAGKMNLAGKLSGITDLCGLDVTPEVFAEHVHRFAKTHSLTNGKPPIGLCLSLPGIIDSQRGFMIRSVRLGQWKNVDLTSLLEPGLNMPLIIENDTRCLAWSHVWFNRNLAASPALLCVSITSGIACATILDGQLYRGGQFAAGEIGHVKSGNKGIQCHCGKLNCLETSCSIPAIIEEIDDAAGVKTIDDIAEKADNKAVTDAIDYSAKHLAGILSPVMATLDPIHLVIASDNLKFSNLISKPLHQYLTASLVGHDAAKAQLISAGNLVDDEKRGAGALLIENFFKNGGRYSQPQNG